MGLFLFKEYMKVTYEIKPKEETKFPCVRKWNGFGKPSIFLFTSRNTGVCLYEPDADNDTGFSVGHIEKNLVDIESYNWIPCSITFDSLND